MINILKKIINFFFGIFNLQLVHKVSYDKLLNNKDKFRDYELLELINQNYKVDYFNNLKLSKSQLRQDLFVLSELGFKKKGFFVEFGATDGINLSNTYLLEKKFDWDGILAEPAKIWHSKLSANRSSKLETDCVWSESGKNLLFNEVNDRIFKGELSTINNFSSSDGHYKLRKLESNKYLVNTISLLDMLKKHNAPYSIDYLSIDTEGSEYEILKAFDFDAYDIKIITCEHNFTSNREKIYSLLSANRYVRKHNKFSLFDDWYVRI